MSHKVTCVRGLAGRLAKVLPIVVAVCVGFAAGCAKGPRQQSETLDDKSRVILLDAWVLEHTPELLQIKLRYDGVDPNRTYNLRATVGGDKERLGWGGGWIKQIPIPSGNTTNQLQVIWEFLGFPKDTANIYFRLDFADKESGLARSVDFKLPGTRHLRTRKMGSQ